MQACRCISFVMSNHSRGTGCVAGFWDGGVVLDSWTLPANILALARQDPGLRDFIVSWRGQRV